MFRLTRVKAVGQDRVEIIYVDSNDGRKTRMTSALDIIREEHRAVARILSLLEDSADADATLARAVESGKVAAILRFLRNFLSAVHHPKEEKILYPALAAKGSSIASDFDGYLQGHDIDYALLQGIETALAGAENALGRARLGETILAYVGHKRRHVGQEEDVILPRAGQILDAAALEAMTTAFATNNGSSAHANWRAEWKALVGADNPGGADRV
jgi:hemerythrin-like domain-containing protein